MKTTATILCAFFVTMQLSANNFYDQLCSFNPNWTKYEAFVKKSDAKIFASDKEYIQAHLATVLPILEAASTKELSEKQIQSRKQMIQWLTEYREQGNFPQNYFHPGRVPVFIDENGTHCAVGYLMQQSGEEEMAQRISKTHHYDWVKDIKDENLGTWQDASGLSLEELKLIQGAYESYADNGFFLVNKIEIPQKPTVLVAYFDNKPKTEANIWCKGEGAGKVLNGKWIQKYAVDKPWIEGYYANGKRTGLWKEYYQGTTLLCRTENWRDDKLNGIRKRYSKAGVLTEEILFKNGKAELKTNYELSTGLKYVRKQLDTATVYTEVYTLDGLLLACGKEKIYNPGNLQWFQNIELTTLNTIQYATSNPASSSSGSSQLYATPALVEYHKEGKWMYYREYNYQSSQQKEYTLYTKLQNDFQHFAHILYSEMKSYSKVSIGEAGYDSIGVEYKDNLLRDFYGYSKPFFTHLKIVYNTTTPAQFFINNWNQQPQVRVIGQYSKDGKKKGEWLHYNEFGILYKTENYFIPCKEEELVTGF